MGAWYSNLRGIFGSIFQFGTSGPNLKVNGTSLEARNAADTVYAPFRAGLQAITPAALGANVNDYAPTGIETAQILRQATTSAVGRTITGLQAPSPAWNQRIWFTALGPGSLTLSNNHGASAAANRFLMGGNVSLAVDESIQLQYDVTAARWRAENV